MVQFERSVQEATFHSPLADFEEVTAEIEVREDPLTGRQCRIVPDVFLRPEDPQFEEFVTDAEGCFFCPDRVEEATPTYPDWFGADRGRVGEATSFPNLNPYGAYSNVVALTEDHYVPIDEFTPRLLGDGLQAALEFVTAVLDRDDDAVFASVNMNFLRPAGSSIVHPHVQTLVDERGTNEQALRAEPARAYRDANGTSYWADLAESERDGGERYVGSTGGVEWVAPFAPEHHRHVLGVAPGVDVPDPRGDVVADFATGLANVLSSYGSAGLNSFNFALHLVAGDDAIPPVLDVVARSVFDRYYWSDATFFATIHDEGVIDVPPEEYAAEARKFF